MNTTTNSTRADVYSRVTNRIIADLEQGVRPWMKPWKPWSTQLGVELEPSFSLIRVSTASVSSPRDEICGKLHPVCVNNFPMCHN